MGASRWNGCANEGDVNIGDNMHSGTSGSVGKTHETQGALAGETSDE